MLQRTWKKQSQVSNILSSPNVSLVFCNVTSRRQFNNIAREQTVRFDVLRIGLNLQVAQKPDEVDILKEEIAKELSSALGNIRLAERGVFVQASTLGALEALLDFLKSSKIPVSFNIDVSAPII